MNQSAIKPESTFKVVSEWERPDLSIGDEITITDNYSIRGTHFMVVDEDCEDIPRYEFTYALRTGLIEHIE